MESLQRVSAQTLQYQGAAKLKTLFQNSDLNLGRDESCEVQERKAEQLLIFCNKEQKYGAIKAKRVLEIKVNQCTYLCALRV